MEQNIVNLFTTRQMLQQLKLVLSMQQEMVTHLQVGILLQVQELILHQHLMLEVVLHMIHQQVNIRLHFMHIGQHFNTAWFTLKTLEAQQIAQQIRHWLHSMLLTQFWL